MSNWKKYKLGDLGFFFGGVTSIKKEDYGHGTPFLPYKNVYKNSKVNVNELELMNVRPLDLERRNAVYGDIFFTASSETPDEVAMSSVLLDEVENLTFNGFCKRFRLNDFNTLLPEYARYLFRDISFRREVYQLATGDIRFNISQESLANIEIEIPDLPTQRQIAQILSSLDDKIELNLQMNQTLEAMAQAIFKEWFVNFNFPGFDGELVDGLPKGWRMLAIGELFKLTIGGDWGKEEYSDEFSENSFVVRGTDFDKIVTGNISSVPNRFIKKSNFVKRKIENGDILLEISGGSKDQPTGRTILFTDELLSQFNSSVVAASFCRLIRPLNFEYSLFLDTFFKYFYQIGGTWEYQNQSTGISNFQFVFFSENKKIALPENEVLIHKFSEIIKPMKKRIDENTIQIQSLTQTRDTLLPKLMSGALEVKSEE
jgi:type I restriction enzyme S subunit